MHIRCVHSIRHFDEAYQPKEEKSSDMQLSSNGSLPTWPDEGFTLLPRLNPVICISLVGLPKLELPFFCFTCKACVKL